MTRLVAFLRGINVGGHAKIGMAPLREAVAGLGFDDVRTHLQSGNLLLTSDAPAKRVGADLERLIADRFALDVRVVVRTRDELAAVVEGNPLPEAVAEPAQFLVVFLSAAPAKSAVAALDPAAFAPDEFRVQGREVYLHCPNGIRNSKLAAYPWDKRLGLTATARNWKTVTRLLEMAGD